MTANDRKMDDASVSAADVLKELEGLPGNDAFLLMLLGALGLYLAYSAARYLLFTSSVAAEIDSRATHLEPRDKTQLFIFMGRALGLRFRASLFLAAAFFLLFGGVYFTVFLVPELQNVDDRAQSARAEARLEELERLNQAEFSKAFDARLNRVAKGAWIGMAATPAGGGATVEPRKVSILDPNRSSAGISTQIVAQTGTIAVAAGNAGFLTSPDSGRSWSAQQGISLKDTEVLNLVKFSRDGRTGIAAGDEGAVISTVDRGRTWFVPDGIVFRQGEYAYAVNFTGSDRAGVLIGDEGSVFSTQDGRQWTSEESIPFEKDDELTASVLFLERSNKGFLLGDEGSFFATLNGGLTWSLKATIDLDVFEFAEFFRISGGGGTLILAGDEGTVLTSVDGGGKWNPPMGVELGQREWIVDIQISGDLGIMTTNDSKMFVTVDDGTSWQSATGVDMEADEAIISVSYKSEVVFLVGDRGTILVSKNSGKSWSRQGKVQLMSDERVRFSRFFGMNGTSGIVVGDKGTIAKTSESGKLWKKSAPVQMKTFEVVDRVEFSEDGTFGIIVGDEGTVFASNDAGAEWQTFPAEASGSPVAFTNARLVGTRAVGLDAAGRIHVLLREAELSKLVRQPPQDVQAALVKQQPPITGSLLRREIDSFADDSAVRLEAEKAAGEALELSVQPEESSPANAQITTLLAALEKLVDAESRTNPEALVASEISDLRQAITASENSGSDALDGLLKDTDNMIIRAVTLVVIFFLVQVLIRLYQYNIRLAAFQDSRADALMLSGSLAEGRLRFDELVITMSPDSYDFKQMPKHSLDHAMEFAKSTVRRG